MNEIKYSAYLGLFVIVLFVGILVTMSFPAHEQEEGKYILIAIDKKLDNPDLKGPNEVPRAYRDRVIDACDYWGINYLVTHDIFPDYYSKDYSFDGLILIEPSTAMLNESIKFSMKHNGSYVLIIDPLSLSASTNFGLIDKGPIKSLIPYKYINTTLMDSIFKFKFRPAVINPRIIAIKPTKWTIENLMCTDTNNSTILFRINDTKSKFILYNAQEYTPGIGNTTKFYNLILSYWSLLGLADSYRDTNRAETITPLIIRCDDLRYQSDLSAWRQYWNKTQTQSAALIINSSGLSEKDMPKGVDVLPHGYNHENWENLSDEKLRNATAETRLGFEKIFGIYPIGMVMPYNKLNKTVAKYLLDQDYRWATASYSQAQVPINFWYNDTARFLYYSGYYELPSDGNFTYFVNKCKTEMRGAMFVFHPTYDPGNQSMINKDLIILQKIVDLSKTNHSFELINLSDYMNYNLNRESSVRYFVGKNS